MSLHEHGVNPETIIGGDGPLWSVTAHIPPGVRDSFHVRAMTPAGAAALGQEMRPDATYFDVFRVEDSP